MRSVILDSEKGNSYPMKTKIFLTILVVYIFHFTPFRYLPLRHECLAISLAENWSIKVNQFEGITIDIFKFGEGYFINTNPGGSFLALPFLFPIFKTLNWLKPTILADMKLKLFCGKVLSAFSTMLFSSFLSLLIYCYVLEKSHSQRRAIFSSFLFSFGTIIFHNSTSFNHNTLIACFVFFSYVLIYCPESINIYSHSNILFFFVGFILGIGIFVDLSIFPYIAALGVSHLPVANWQNLRKASCILIGFIPGIAALLLYQFFAFGDPLMTPQRACYGDQWEGTFFKVLSSLVLVKEHVFGLNHGFLVYMPFTILSFWYFLVNWNNNQSKLSRSEKKVIFWSVFFYFLMAGGMLSSINTHFGPRYLLPIVSFSTIVFILNLKQEHYSLASRLCLFSFLFNIVGAQIGYSTVNLLSALGVYFMRGPWLPFYEFIVSGKLFSLINRKFEFVYVGGFFFGLLLLLLIIWMDEIVSFIRAQQNKWETLT